MADQTTAWRCRVCGYIHHDVEPPETCPVCGAPRSAFVPYEEEPPSSPPREANQWRCLVCNYVHHGPQPPEKCPLCGAGADAFEPLTEEQSVPASVAAAAPTTIVLGAGIAGVAAVEALRRASPKARITLVSNESDLPYYRLNLTRYMAGEIDKQALPMHPESWYREQNIELLLGAEVSAVDLADHSVTIDGAHRLVYEKLLLAAGAHPFIPPFPGTHLAGVTALRTVEDVDRILEAAAAGAACVCIGGGLLGLETAGGLARRGADVTLLEGHGWLLPRQLNRRAGEILADYATRLGIQLRKQARTREILGNGHVQAVRLEDETVIPADLVVIATGIRSNSHLARTAGLDVHQGIVVDDTLQTSHPDVFAAGDAAEHRGVMYGLWNPAQFQGSIAGMNLAGLAVHFGGIPPSAVLKVLDIDLFSIGQIVATDASAHAVSEEIDGRYYHFVLRDDRLVGAILLGDTSLTTALNTTIESSPDLSGPLGTHPTARAVIEFLRGLAP